MRISIGYCVRNVLFGGGVVGCLVLITLYLTNSNIRKISQSPEILQIHLAPEVDGEPEVPEGWKVQNNFNVQKDIEKLTEFGRDLDTNLKTSSTSNNIVYQLFNFKQPPTLLPQSAALTNTKDIINYAQQYHYELFEQLLRPYKYVMVLDVALHENKGDPAITIGEFFLLQKLRKIVLYYCGTGTCTESNLRRAQSLAEKYSSTNVAIMLHGGGNIMGWYSSDKLRSKIFNIFKGYHFFLFPQSVFMVDDSKHLAFCENLYRNQANFTMVLRDLNSYMLAKKHFSGKSTLLISPDMAFQIGYVKRFIKPFYDILWIRRTDREKVTDRTPEIPSDITVKIGDWFNWPTPWSNINMERAHLIAYNGMVFLQRGRVVITDRLHGHIISTLLDIPHVIINNKWNKIGNYHNTWTLSSSITRVADNSSHAIVLAKQLLHEYKHVLPEKVPYTKVRDSF